MATGHRPHVGAFDHCFDVPSQNAYRCMRRIIDRFAAPDVEDALCGEKICCGTAVF